MAIYGEPATEPSDDDQPAIVVPDDPDDRECDISADSDRQRVEPDEHRTAASTAATMPLMNGVTQPADSGSPVLPGTKVVHTDAREGTDDRLT